MGAVVYAEDSRSDFYLNTYTTRYALRSRLSTLGRYYPNSFANTGAGLMRVRTEQFVSQAGDRPQVNSWNQTVVAT